MVPSWEVVLSRGAPKPAGTLVFVMWKIFTHRQSVTFKHSGIWGWGIYGSGGRGHFWLKWEGHWWLNGCGMYDINAWGSYGKVSYCFLGDMLKKTLVLRGVPFPVISWPRVLVPLNSQPDKIGMHVCIYIVFQELESSSMLLFKWAMATKKWRHPVDI